MITETVRFLPHHEPAAEGESVKPLAGHHGHYSRLAVRADAPPRETLARLLARAAAEIRGLDGALLDHHVERFAASWERRVPAIVAAVLAEHATDERQEPFVHDSPVEPA